jgi:hypothetical protein
VAKLKKRKTRCEAGEWKHSFLAALRASGVVRFACQAAGVSHTVAYEWKKNDPEFAVDWDDAHETAIDMIEVIGIERAKRKSDLLLIFSLKAFRPEKYTDDAREAVKMLHALEKEIARIEGATARPAAAVPGALGNNADPAQPGLLNRPENG